MHEALAWTASASDAALNPNRLAALVFLGEAQAAAGQPALARSALDEAQAIRARQASLGPQYDAPLARLAARLGGRPTGRGHLAR